MKEIAANGGGGDARRCRVVEHSLRTGILREPGRLEPDAWTGGNEGLRAGGPAGASARAPAAAPAGGLGAIWRQIVGFFRRLLGLEAAPRPVGDWPAYNPDARRQIFEAFPTGQGAVFGFVPVRVWRDGQVIYGEAGGHGRGAIYWWSDELYYQQEGKSPDRVDSAVSQRDAAGDTHFEIVADGGKRFGATLLADGRTLRYQGYQVTLY